MRRSVRLGFVAVSSILLLASLPRPVLGDAVSAEAEIPASREPFFLVTTTTTTASAFDDLTRRPEYAVYADGTFIVQKSDGRLWGAALSRADVVEFMRFVLEEAKFPEIDMRYVVASPITTFTQFALTTRSGSYAARRRAASLVGIGTKSGEKALAAIETKLIALADRAQVVYTPGAMLVVAKRISAGDQMPTWAAEDRVPFAQLLDAADIERKTGTVVLGAEAEAVRSALALGPQWRSGALAGELRARPAMPHERPEAAPTPATPSPIPPVISPPPAMGDALPVPPPMPPPVPAPTPVTPVPPATPVPPVAPTPPIAPAPSATLPAATATPDTAWKDDDVDFAGVQKIFVDLNRKTSGSPHGKFWTKTYEEFVAYEFDSADGKVKLLEAGKGAESNLVRALEGRPLLVRAANGTTKPQDFARMPPKGAPVPAADIERVRRWIDHGAPQTRPAGGDAPSPAAGNAATPTGETRALMPVGTDTAKLGIEGPAEDGRAAPASYVARSAADWSAIFATRLPQAGTAGTRVAKALKPLLEASVKGYDFAAAPLVLLVGPITDNYAADVPTMIALLSDGSARMSVRHAHEDRTYAVAPELGVWWAVLRIDGSCPEKLLVAEPSK